MHRIALGRRFVTAFVPVILTFIGQADRADDVFVIGHVEQSNSG
jgi:hypothetical protein